MLSLHINTHNRFKLDVSLLLGVLALSFVGLVMVMSASLQIAETSYNSPFYFFHRHLVYWVLAVLVGVLTYFFMPASRVSKLAFLAYPLAIFVLVLLFVPGLGRSVNGSLRWLNIAGLTVQPAEFTKVFFIVYLASFIERRQELLMTQWTNFFIPLGALGVPAVLLLMQPDFGSLVVVTIAAMGMLFLAGVPLMRFLVVGAPLAGIAGLLVMAAPYRVERLMSFTNPWLDQFGSGYQLTQSLIAFGQGHWLGVGLGNSIQKLFYLPEAHTDFVYAVIAEELGLVGNLALIAAFFFVVSRMFLVGYNLARKGFTFEALCVYGFSFVFGVQACINFGVNMGVLPTKGLTLPFVSYGGSSLLVSAAMVAFTLRAHAEAQKIQPEKAKAANAGDAA